MLPSGSTAMPKKPPPSDNNPPADTMACSPVSRSIRRTRRFTPWATSRSPLASKARSVEDPSANKPPEANTDCSPVIGSILTIRVLRGDSPSSQTTSPGSSGDAQEVPFNISTTTTQSSFIVVFITSFPLRRSKLKRLPLLPPGAQIAACRGASSHICSRCVTPKTHRTTKEAGIYGCCSLAATGFKRGKSKKRQHNKFMKVKCKNMKRLFHVN